MSWDYRFEVEDEDNIDNFQNFATDHEGLVIIIDVSKLLFDNKISSNNEELSKLTCFQAIIKGCLAISKNKALTRTNDSVGIIFSHVKNTTESMMKTVHVFKNFEPSSIESIKKLMELESISEEEFEEKYGLNDEGSLYHALWCAQTLFAKSKTKFSQKQIILFTTDDDPSYKNEDGKKALLVKSRDLRQANIHLELIPVANSNFQFQKFYKTLISANVSEDNADSVSISDSTEALEELLKRIRHKQYQKRSLGRIEWRLGNDKLKIGVSIYNLIRSTPPPSTIKLDRDSNIEVLSRRIRVLKETGQQLMPFDMKKCLNIAGKPICFEQEEVKKIKSIREPGLNLIGFKPLKLLKNYYQIRGAQFLYPDESVIQGGARLFAALLHRCAQRQLFILCSYIGRRGSPIRLVALLPQLEEVNEKGVQVKPSGFHIFFLPYSDDIRSLNLSSAPEVTESDKEKCKKLIQAMCVEYEPDTILNPSLQKKLAVIESLALEYENPIDIEDHTVVNTSEINEHCGEELKQFRTYFNLPNLGESPVKKPTKSTVKKEQPASMDINDLDSLVKGNQLAKMTVPQLKQLAKQHGISLKGTKKQDIIDSIEANVNK